jgi:uncharacterized protein
MEHNGNYSGRAPRLLKGHHNHYPAVLPLWVYFIDVFTGQTHTSRSMTKPKGITCLISIAAKQSASIRCLCHRSFGLSTFTNSNIISPFASRKMSSTASQPTSSQKEWLVLLPDHPNSLSKRVSVRQEHLTGVKPTVASGKVLFGGATLSKHPAEGESPDMTGSVMLMTAESEEEVRRFAAEDVYTKSGVWDMGGIKIWPFRTAVRKGVEVGAKAW